MQKGRAIHCSESGRPHDRCLDSAIGELASRQHGRVARRQLLAAGIPSHVIDRRLASSHLIQELPGVYAVGHRSPTWEGRLMAAHLSAGDDSTVSHLAAGAHQRLIRLRPTVIDVTSPRCLRHRPPFRFHRSQLPADEIEIVDGIPVTTVARTLLDLAAVLSPSRLAIAINESEVNQLTSPTSLPRLLERHPRRPGVAAIREIIAMDRLGFGGTDSELEDRFQVLILGSDLPAPLTRAAIELPTSTGARTVIVDNLWMPQRVVLELDGDRFHRTVQRRRSDMARDRMLTTAGYLPLRAGWHDVTHPSDLLADPHRLLSESRA